MVEAMLLTVGVIVPVGVTDCPPVDPRWVEKKKVAAATKQELSKRSFTDVLF